VRSGRILRWLVIALVAVAAIIRWNLLRWSEDLPVDNGIRINWEGRR